MYILGAPSGPALAHAMDVPKNHKSVRVSAETDMPALPRTGLPDRTTPQVPATTSESNLSAERLFRGLDGCWIAVAGDRWRAEVYGVIQEGGWRWVQLGLHGAREHMITLRTLPSSGVGQLILVLSGWLSGGERGPEIVSVA